MSVGEGHINIRPHEHSATNGTWVWHPTLYISTEYFSRFYYNSSAADGDYLEWGVCLDAGTYTLMMIATAANNRAIVDMQIDGGVEATFDMYSAGQVNNKRFTQTNIVVATAGIAILKMVINGKTGSSYFALPSLFTLWRTA